MSIKRIYLIYFILLIPSLYFTLEERSFFDNFLHFNPLASAGNEKTFFETARQLSKYFDITNAYFFLTESKFFILSLTLIANLSQKLVSLQFPNMIIFNLIGGFLTLFLIKNKFKLNSSLLIELILVSVILTYSLVLLRDIWIIFFILANYYLISKKKYFLGIITLILIFDLRFFSGLIQLLLISKFFLKRKSLLIFIVLLSSIILANYLQLFQDFIFTYNKYRLKEIEEISSSGLTALISNFIPSYWAVRLTFLFSPVPTLFLKISSVYTFFVGIGSLITFIWIHILTKLNFKKSFYFLFPVLIIAFTSAEVRHKIPYMILVIVYYYGLEYRQANYISNSKLT